MTEAEKEHFLDVWRRQQEGYRKIQRLRDLELQSMSVKQGVAGLRTAFQIAGAHPVQRKSSGLVEFYAALKKSAQ